MILQVFSFHRTFSFYPCFLSMFQNYWSSIKIAVIIYWKFHSCQIRNYRAFPSSLTTVKIQFVYSEWSHYTVCTLWQCGFILKLQYTLFTNSSLTYRVKSDETVRRSTDFTSCFDESFPYTCHPLTGSVMEGKIVLQIVLPVLYVPYVIQSIGFTTCNTHEVMTWRRFLRLLGRSLLYLKNELGPT